MGFNIGGEGIKVSPKNVPKTSRMQCLPYRLCTRIHLALCLPLFFGEQGHRISRVGQTQPQLSRSIASVSSLLLAPPPPDSTKLVFKCSTWTASPFSRGGLQGHPNECLTSLLPNPPYQAAPSGFLHPTSRFQHLLSWECKTEQSDYGVAIAASGAAAAYTHYAASICTSSTRSRRSSSSYAPPPWNVHVVLGRGGCGRGMPSDRGTPAGPRLCAAPAPSTPFLLLGASSFFSKRARARHEKICHHHHFLQPNPSSPFCDCCCYCRPRCCRRGQGTRYPQGPAS
jgi:hypothetical protein